MSTHGPTPLPPEAPPSTGTNTPEAAQKQSAAQRRASWRRRVIFAVQGLAILILGALRYIYNVPLTEWQYSRYAKVLFLLLIGYLILNAGQTLLLYFYFRRNRAESPKRANFSQGITQIRYLLFLVLVGLSALQLLDVALVDVFTSLSIVAAALAILFKEYITNMLNGLIIMFSNQISIGDDVRIRVGSTETEGRIEDINLLNVQLLNTKLERVMVPNNLVFMAEVTNYTKRSEQWASYEFELPTTHPDSLEVLEQALLTVLEQHTDVAKRTGAHLHIVGFAGQQVQYQLLYYLKRGNLRRVAALHDALGRQVLHFLRQEPS